MHNYFTDNLYAQSQGKAVLQMKQFEKVPPSIKLNNNSFIHICATMIKKNKWKELQQSQSTKSKY
jgi:hypothetical protein